jgi:hypothetical protein
MAYLHEDACPQVLFDLRIRLAAEYYGKPAKFQEIIPLNIGTILFGEEVGKQPAGVASRKDN